MLRRAVPMPDKLLYALCISAITSALALVLFHQVLVERTSRSNFEFNNAACGKNDYFIITLWDKDVCKRTFENLAQYPRFPFYPDLHYCANRWSSVLEKVNEATITRIQTRLRPIESGFYKFRVGSSSAFQIFLEAGCRSGEITAVVQSHGGRNNEQVYSKGYLLYSHCSYYFEIILFSLPGENEFSLEWLVPGGTEFRQIQSREFVQGTRMEISRHPLVRSSEDVPPNEHSVLSFIPKHHIVQSCPLCSSADEKQLKSWNSLTRKTVVYVSPGELPRDINESVQIVMAGLDKAIPRKYPSSKIIKIEITPNATHIEPRRLLIDLELTVDGLDYKQRLSEYYLGWYHGNNLTLCRPSFYQWNRLVELNFVFLDCYEKQSVWVEYFIQNMAQLLQASLDVHFKVVVTTCDEEAARSYESRLRGSGFDRYAVVQLEGVYSQSRGMKAVMSVVEDNESIIVLCDSQVNMPAVILEEIRKHTFKNVMAFSPIPFQLACGYFPGSVSVKGDWCPQCASLVALYKDDWAKVLTDESELFHWKNGSRPTSCLKDKRKLLQRITNSGIEVIQVNQNGLYRL